MNKERLITITPCSRCDSDCIDGVCITCGARMWFANLRTKGVERMTDIEVLKMISALETKTTNEFKRIDDKIAAIVAHLNKTIDESEQTQRQIVEGRISDNFNRCLQNDDNVRKWVHDYFQPRLISVVENDDELLRNLWRRIVKLDESQRKALLELLEAIQND